MTAPLSYEVFEHTADIGLHAYGATLAELFVHVAQGMESLMVAPEQIRTEVRREVVVEGHNEISLLIAWLNELIFLFNTEYLLFHDFTVDALSANQLKVYDRRSLQCSDGRRVPKICRWSTMFDITLPGWRSTK